MDQYVHNALETNKREALRDEATIKTGKPKRYVFLDHVVERAKDREVLRDQSISMLLGGTETTASLLGNLLYVLARRPDIWNKLRAEALEFTESMMNQDGVKDAIYLSYCWNESQSPCFLDNLVWQMLTLETAALRLYPVLPVTAPCSVRDTAQT